MNSTPPPSPTGERRAGQAALAAASVVVAATLWLGLIAKLGAWRWMRTAAPGVLSYTFDGWREWPIAAHMLLGQHTPTAFAEGLAYRSYTYPYLLAMYAVVAPIHALLGVPYSVAHNVLPLLHVVLFVGLFAWLARAHLAALVGSGHPVDLVCLFLLIGLIVVTPAAWSCMLLFNRDNLHFAIALVFCWLSVDLTRDPPNRARFLAGGVFVALYAPIYFPAWMLGRLCLDRQPARVWSTVRDGLVVGALSAVSWLLPWSIGRLAGVKTVGSGYLYRSGLNGSREWLHDLWQAMLWPPPSAFVPYQRVSVATHLLAVVVALVWLPGPADAPAPDSTRRARLRQAAFLTLPYLSIAILLPQFTAIHPYFTDVLLLVPSAFVLCWWSVEAAGQRAWSGMTVAFWALGAMVLLMTDLLHIAQVLRSRP